MRQYELIKAGQHPKLKRVWELTRNVGMSRQLLNKYIRRYESMGEEGLLPQKRGQKLHTIRKYGEEIRERVIELRRKGYNRYDIIEIMGKESKEVPSKSWINKKLEEYGLNKMTDEIKKEHKRIIKERVGELGHIDSHYLPKNIIKGDGKRYYLISVIDDSSRLMWSELTDNLSSLNVMFRVMRCLQMLKMEYKVEFEEVMTDNGCEYGSGPRAKNKESNPVERLLKELGIRHIYTRPYRPQTNGKVERLWGTLEEELLSETYESREALEEGLQRYIIYYNEHRPHQGIGNKTPLKQSQICQRIK
jgi:transposase InsO family protein